MNKFKMKKVLLLVMVFVLATSNAQDLKGYTLGDIYEGKMTEGMGIIPETLGGIDGSIVIKTLNDKRICNVFFMPSDRLYGVDLEKLVNGLNNKFGIKLKKSGKGNDATYKYSNDEYNLFINTDYNQYMTPTTQVTIMLADIELEKIKTAEDQKKANSDF